MKACIFDLDGVLVDTARYHFLAWKRLANELGIDLSEKENEHLKGVGRMESLNIILNLGGISLSEKERTDWAARKNKWFVEYIMAMKKEEIFPGALELFMELRKHDVKIGLASSSKNACTVLDKLEITGEFEAVVDGNMIENSKPHPEIFLKAAGLLNTRALDCVVIEDAEAGVEAARRAGMKCVGIGNPNRLGRANLICNAIGELNYETLNNL